MIKFINSDGAVYEGSSPYIHWFEGGQSTGLWYARSIMVITDKGDYLRASGFSDDSVFKVVDKDILLQTEYPTIFDWTDDDGNEHYGIACNDYPDSHGEEIGGYTVYQILILGESDAPGQFTDDLTITNGVDTITVTLGADFYDKDEILEINLGNRGMELPESIQKAFLNSNISDDGIDNILINRKFKELISNYIDIIDNRGSYKSLFNSLEWFEWGENAKLYEIWQGDSGYFEKELESNLSDEYQSLLYTHRKTTHLSLIALLNNYIKEAGPGSFDNEKNPKLEKIAYQWTDEELALKISILGAFFERYFMPIHLDLKRASVEAKVYTNSIKTKCGTMTRTFNFHDDTGVVDIQMDHIVTLGNIPGYAVSAKTVFGRQWEAPPAAIRDTSFYLDPIGVDLITDINASDMNFQPGGFYEDNSSQLGTFYGQLKGGVGVVVPIAVTVPFPDYETGYGVDGINVETINVYRDYEEGSTSEPLSLTERRLWLSDVINEDEVEQSLSDYFETHGEWPDDMDLDNPSTWPSEIVRPKWAARFTFNLLSTHEEKVTFTLVLHSLSGHTWTATASYQCIDISGSYLEVCKITDVDHWGTGERLMPTYDLFHGNPFGTQYNTITVNNENYDGEYIDPTKYGYDTLTQYISNVNPLYLNEIVIVENKPKLGAYDDNWEPGNNRNFWILHRGSCGEISSVKHYKYTILIRHNSGEFWSDTQWNINLELWATSAGLSVQAPTMIRHDHIFIPQIHGYGDLDDLWEPIDEETGRLTMGNYAVTQDEPLFAIPQFKKSIPINPNSIKWEFENATTGETIQYNIPMSSIAIADSVNKPLGPGYWNIRMYFTLDGSTEVHCLSKNSAFKMRVE